MEGMSPPTILGNRKLAGLSLDLSYDARISALCSFALSQSKRLTERISTANIKTELIALDLAVRNESGDIKAAPVL